LFQTKLEAQYNAKHEVHVSEVNDLKLQLEARAVEIRNLNATVDSLKSVNEELKVSAMFRFFSRVGDLIVWDYDSVRLPSRPLASKAARTLRKAHKIWSAPERRLTFNLRSLMA
jgi:hypothetical protein